MNIDRQPITTTDPTGTQTKAPRGLRRRLATGALAILIAAGGVSSASLATSSTPAEATLGAPGSCKTISRSGTKRCYNGDGSYCDYDRTGKLLGCADGDSGW